MDEKMTMLCKEINNYFRVDSYTGNLKVEAGVLIGIPSDFLQDGQYFCIRDSVFNDGVYTYPAKDLADEKEFKGTIWAMAVPKEVISLAQEIADWNERYGGVDSPSMSPFNSESFGVYSYSKGSVSSGGSEGASNPNDWREFFSVRLSRYRRIRGIL